MYYTWVSACSRQEQNKTDLKREKKTKIIIEAGETLTCAHTK